MNKLSNKWGGFKFKGTLIMDYNFFFNVTKFLYKYN